MKLEVKQLEVIRNADREKTSAKDLAAKFDVSVARIYEIWRGPKDPHYSKLLKKAVKAGVAKKAAA